MDFQTSKEELKNITIEEAAKKLDCYPSDLQYYAWPEGFGSTSGPFKGIGGQAMSTFTIEAWTDGRKALIFCKGRIVKIVDKFIPMNIRL